MNPEIVSYLTGVSNQEHILLFGASRNLVLFLLSLPGVKTITIIVTHRSQMALLSAEFSDQKTVQVLYWDFDTTRSLPFKDQIFDFVLVHHALRSVLYRESLLKYFFSIIRPGKQLCVIEHTGFRTRDNDDFIEIDTLLEYVDRAGFMLLGKIETNNMEYGIVGIREIVEV